jgi:hypothetical protein
MKTLKQKLTLLFGSISTLLGGIGTIIAEFGLCVCAWAPILSLLGTLSIVMGFLSKNKIYFFIIGIILLLISLLLHKRKKHCKVHRKI